MNYFYFFTSKLTLCLLLCIATTGLMAQTKPLSSGAKKPVEPIITAHTTTGDKFELAKLRGKVVVVYFWSTNCSICLDVMNEIRINTQGWVDQPFATVAVNLNKNRADFDGYIYTLRMMSQDQNKVTHVYGADHYYNDNLNVKNKLPTAFVINVKGELVARYEGRIPAQAWDKIADLLP